MTVGEFKIVSGAVFVTDPCYDKTTWCQAKLDGVKNGTWFASIERGNEDRVAKLTVLHESVADLSLSFEKIDADIGVDSGQAGVFDAQFFKDDASVAGVERLHPDNVICGDEPFYSICCDRTTSGDDAGIIPYGAVSSTGYGDGSYDAFVAKNNQGEIVGIEIVFMDEDNNEYCEHCGSRFCDGSCEDDDDEWDEDEDQDLEDPEDDE